MHGQKQEPKIISTTEVAIEFKLLLVLLACNGMGAKNELSIHNLSLNNNLRYDMIWKIFLPLLNRISQDIIFYNFVFHSFMEKNYAYQA